MSLAWGDPTAGDQHYVTIANPLPVTGGGGGGGAATIADGADVCEGTTTDAEVVGNNPGTISAKLRGINAALAGTLTVSGAVTATNATAANFKAQVTGQNDYRLADLTVQGRQTDPTVINVTTSTPTASVSVGGMGTALFTISGTYSSLTAKFEGAPDPSSTVDGSATFFTLQGARVSSNAVEQGPTTLTNTGRAWLVDCAGMNRVRLNPSAISGGTAVLTITPIMPAIRACPTVQTNSTAPTSIDVGSWGGTTTALGQTVMASSVPVTLASNQTNVPTNTVQIGGTNVDVNSGNKSAGTQRVVLATDQPNLTTAFNVADTTLGLSQASATASQKGVLVQGAVTTSAPTYVTAQTDPLSLTTAGAVRSDLNSLAGTAVDTNSGNKSAGTQRVVLATDQPALTNALNTVPVAGTSGASTPFRYLGAAAANQDSHNVKSSAGTLYSIMAFNTSTSIRYVKFYDGANPTSASTPVLVLALPGYTTGSGAVVCPTVGMAFASAIAFRLTTGQADNDGTAITSGDVVVSGSFL